MFCLLAFSCISLQIAMPKSKGKEGSKARAPKRRRVDATVSSTDPDTPQPAHDPARDVSALVLQQLAAIQRGQEESRRWQQSLIHRLENTEVRLVELEAARSAACGVALAREEPNVSVAGETGGSAVRTATAPVAEPAARVSAVGSSVVPAGASAEPAGNADDMAGMPDLSMYDAPVPLGFYLRDSVRASIREWRYVDFKTMMDESDVSVARLELEGSTVVLGKEKEKSKKITWPAWLRAWNTYVAVATEEHVSRTGLAASMAKHFQAVEELKMGGRNWRQYDREYRKLIEKNRALWGKVHSETMDRARAQEDEDIIAARSMPASSGTFRGRGVDSSRQSNVKVPEGFCYSFHKGFCTRVPCKFSHVCFNGGCGGSHPFFRCPKPVTRPFRFPPPKFSPRWRGNGRGNNHGGAAGRGNTYQY